MLAKLSKEEVLMDQLSSQLHLLHVLLSHPSLLHGNSLVHPVVLVALLPLLRIMVSRIKHVRKVHQGHNSWTLWMQCIVFKKERFQVMTGVVVEVYQQVLL